MTWLEANEWGGGTERGARERCNRWVDDNERSSDRSSDRSSSNRSFGQRSIDRSVTDRSNGDRPNASRVGTNRLVLESMGAVTSFCPRSIPTRSLFFPIFHSLFFPLFSPLFVFLFLPSFPPFFSAAAALTLTTPARCACPPLYALVLFQLFSRRRRWRPLALRPLWASRCPAAPWLPFRHLPPRAPAFFCTFHCTLLYFQTLSSFCPLSPVARFRWLSFPNPRYRWVFFLLVLLFSFCPAFSPFSPVFVSSPCPSPAGRAKIPGETATGVSNPQQR